MFRCAVRLWVLAAWLSPGSLLAVKTDYFRSLIPKGLQKELREKAKGRKARHIPAAEDALRTVKEVRDLLKEEELSGTPSLITVLEALERRQVAVARFVLGIQEALTDIGIDKKYRGQIMEGLYNTREDREHELKAKLFRIFGAFPEETQREQFQSEFTAFLSEHFFHIARAVETFDWSYRWSKRDMLFNDLPKVRGIVAEHNVKRYLEAYESAPLFAPEVKGKASDWIIRALGWAGVKSLEEAKELNRLIMSGGPYDAIPKEVDPHVSRFYEYGRRFADKYERTHPKSRLLRNLVSLEKKSSVLTYDAKTAPTLSDKIEDTRNRFKQAEEGALAYLENVALAPDEANVAEKLLVNPLWERTFKGALVSLLGEILLTGAQQIERSMTVEEALNLASTEVHSRVKDKLTIDKRLERSIDVLRLPGIQKALLEIQKIASEHESWRQTYEEKRRTAMESLARIVPRVSAQKRLNLLFERVQRRSNRAPLAPLWGETIASYRQRTSSTLTEGEILGALKEVLAWTPRTIEELLTMDEEKVRTQLQKSIPTIKREETLGPLVQKILDAQTKVRDFVAWSASTRNEREKEEAKYFGKAPVYGWVEPLLKDVVAKGGDTKNDADRAVTAPSAVDAYDGNLTYQGRAVHMMAQKTPVNDLVAKTTWRKDVELDPFWSDDLPSSVAIQGDALPFVEVWRRYRQGLEKVSSPSEVPAFLSEFAYENGRSATGKGVLLNAHRNMLGKLASFMVRPDQGHRRSMALAVAYDLAGYRPGEIAKTLEVDEKVVEEGFARIKRMGLNGYFKGLSMSGDKEDITVMDQELRWRRGETAPRIFAMYLFDGHDSQTIADRLGVPVKDVVSVINEIHEKGADNYLDTVLLKNRR